MSATRGSLLIGNYCCICNTNYGLFIDIFRKFENRKYHLLIEEYLNLKVSRRDGYSSKLCHRCLCNLKLCKEFLDQIEASRHAEYLKSCYLCKNRKVELFDVLPHAEKENCLIYKLEQCINYQVPSTNGSPLKLCISCTNKLDILSEMKELARIQTRMKEENNSDSLNNTSEIDPSFDSMPSENLTSTIQLIKQENPVIADITKMLSCRVKLVDIKGTSALNVEETVNITRTRKRKQGKDVIKTQTDLKLQNSQILSKHDIRNTGTSRRGKRNNIESADEEPAKKYYKVTDPKMDASRSVKISPRKRKAQKMESFKVRIQSKSSKKKKSLNKKKGQKINTELRTAKSKSGKQNKSINTTLKPTKKTKPQKNKMPTPKPNIIKFFCSMCNFRTSKKVPMKIHELSHEAKVPMLIIERCDVTAAKAIAKEHLSSQDVETPATSELKAIESSEDEKIPENPLKDESSEKCAEEVTQKQHLNEATENYNYHFSEEHQEDANVADVLDDTCINEITIDNNVGEKSQTVCESDTLEHQVACEVGLEKGAILVCFNSHVITEELEEYQEMKDNASSEEVSEVSGTSLAIIEESEGNPLVNDDANPEQLHEVSENEHAAIEESEVINNAGTEEIHEPIGNKSSISGESQEEEIAEKM